MALTGRSCLLTQTFILIGLQLLLVVISTAWWASSIQSEDNWAQFDDAVDDIRWVIEQTIEWLKALPAPTLPAPPETSQKPALSSDVTWFSREDGKRKVKPLHRLLEAEL